MVSVIRLPVVEPISLPTIPPSNIWDAYILFLFLPLIMRAILLAKPFLRVTKQLAPHGGWFLKRLNELPIKGLGILAFNEILAFMLPMLIVLGFRMVGDPFGWSTWSNSPWLGIIIILLFAGLWIFFDTIRILRIRRMLHAIEKQNIERLKKAADVGLGMRKWLRKFSKRKDIPEEEKESAASRIGKSSLKMWGQRMLFMRRLTPAGLATSVAAAAAIEIARKGADTISDKIDGKMQKEFDKIAQSNSNSLMILFLRDLAMGLAPLLILWLVPSLIA